MESHSNPLYFKLSRTQISVSHIDKSLISSRCNSTVTLEAPLMVSSIACMASDEFPTKSLALTFVLAIIDLIFSVLLTVLVPFESHLIWITFVTKMPCFRRETVTNFSASSIETHLLKNVKFIKTVKMALSVLITYSFFISIVVVESLGVVVTVDGVCEVDEEFEGNVILSLAS